LARIALVQAHESYRAVVRAKVVIMTLGGSGLGPDLRQQLRADARRYLMLALEDERRTVNAPCVIAVGGLIASGKSTLADALGGALACPIVDTDRTRKHLLGVAPTQRVYDGAWSHAYGLDFTRDVYAEVYRRADAVLASGRSVILDASFRTRKARDEAAALARRRGVPFFFLECAAPLEVLRARLVERQGEATVSDGRLEIFDDFVAGWEPVDELTPHEHRVVDTRAPIDAALQTALAHLGKPALTERHEVKASTKRKRQLVDEHDAINLQLLELSNAVEGAELPTIQRATREVQRRLNAHLEFEEHGLFVRLEGAHPARIRELRNEHKTLLASLENLIVEAELHTLRKERVDAFLEALRRHAQQEDESVHAWAGTDVST
jgi:predicted kinase